MKRIILSSGLLLFLFHSSISQTTSAFNTLGSTVRLNQDDKPQISDSKVHSQKPEKVNRLTDLVKEGEPVPSPLTFSSQFERIVIVRMTFGTDLLEGLKNAVKQENIRSAVILCGIGSLTSYHLHSVSKTTFPSENIFYKAEGPYDLVSVCGYVVNGRVHAHITVADHQHMMGGHLEPDTKVYTFGIITIGVLGDEVDLNRIDDTDWR